MDSMCVCVCVSVCIIFLYPFCKFFLLVGIFNQFTFNLIIDMYVPTTIFIIVWGLFLSVIFFSFVSCLEKFIQQFFCKDGLTMLDFLSFCFSVKLLISLSNLNEILAR